MSPRAPERAQELAWTPRLGTGAKLALTAEVLRTYARARRWLRSAELRVVIDRLREVPSSDAAPADPREALVAGARLSRAVTSTLPRLPVDSSCLLQSLVLTGMLARRGIDGRLVIGVRPGEEFGAHAWVEVHGRALLDPQGDEFARLVDL